MRLAALRKDAQWTRAGDACATRSAGGRRAAAPACASCAAPTASATTASAASTACASTLARQNRAASSPSATLTATAPIVHAPKDTQAILAFSVTRLLCQTSHTEPISHYRRCRYVFFFHTKHDHKLDASLHLYTTFYVHIKCYALHVLHLF